MKIMTEQEFLEDTVKHYHANPKYRCRNAVGCFYSPISLVEPIGTGCAIGRKMEPEKAKELDRITANKENWEFDTNIKDVIHLTHLFPEWMVKMDIEFLSDLQSLHDLNGNWSENGITDKGKSFVQKRFLGFDLDFLNEL